MMRENQSLSAERSLYTDFLITEEKIQFKLSFGICTPHPGTELFAQVAEHHPEIPDGAEASLDKLHTQGFFNECFTSLEKQELEKYITTAYRRFYIRPRYLLKKLIRVNSADEFWRLMVAGSNIFGFCMGRAN